MSGKDNNKPTASEFQHKNTFQKVEQTEEEWASLWQARDIIFRKRKSIGTVKFA